MNKQSDVLTVLFILIACCVVLLISLISYRLWLYFQRRSLKKNQALYSLLEPQEDVHHLYTECRKPSTLPVNYCAVTVQAPCMKHGVKNHQDDMSISFNKEEPVKPIKSLVPYEQLSNRRRTKSGSFISEGTTKIDIRENPVQESNNLIDDVSKAQTEPSGSQRKISEPASFQRKISEPVTGDRKISEPGNVYRRFSEGRKSSTTSDTSSARSSITDDMVFSSNAVGIKRRVAAGRRLRKQKSSINNANIESNKMYRKTGCITFITEYDRITEKLIVNINYVSLLPTVNRPENEINPFVKLYLNPGKRQKQQTPIKKCTLEPYFDSTFIFTNLPEDELMKHMMKLKVLNHSSLKKNNNLGEVLIALSSINTSDKETFNTELFLQRSETAFTSIKISLRHEATSSSLAVTIHQIKNLPNSSLLGSYVSVELSKNENIILRQETGVKRNTRDPIFNETLNFKIFSDIHSPISCYKLLVTIYNQSVVSKHDIIGYVIMGAASPQKLAFEQWNLVQNAPFETHTQWHSIISPYELTQITSFQRQDAVEFFE